MLPGAARRHRRTLRWVVQWIAIALVVTFLFLAVRKAIEQLQASPEVLSWDRIHWVWLGIGGLLTWIALIPSGYAWILALRDFGLPVATVDGAKAFYLGHMGKYVPGKAMAVLLRVGSLHRLGIPVRPVIVSVFMETLTSLAAGSILGAILLQTMDVPLWLRGSALAGIPFALIALVPHVFRAIVERISRSRIGAMPPEVSRAIQWPLMVRFGILNLLGWLLHGTASWIVLVAIAPTIDLWNWTSWAACVSSMCLAALAGFLSMIPGGAGVRELIVMWGMATIVPEPVALASAVVTRLIAIASEIVMLAIVSWVARRARSSSTSPDTPDRS